MKKSKTIFKLLFVALSILALNCKEDEEPSVNKLTLPLKEESEHFEFYYDEGINATNIRPIREALEDNYIKITTHFETFGMPKIRIALWSQRKEFDESMNNQYPFAAGYVNGREEVRMFYTGSPSEISGAVHEFTHIVTMFVAEDFANNPRWLWEATAQYESNSFVDPKTLSYVVDGNYPSLQELSNEQGGNQRIYPLGYVLGEFIVEAFGYEGLRSLIKNHGNIKKTFSITEAEFESQWHAFVNEKYL
jgi:hypothetical protein